MPALFVRCKAVAAGTTVLLGAICIQSDEWQAEVTQRIALTSDGTKHFFHALLDTGGAKVLFDSSPFELRPGADSAFGWFEGASDEGIRVEGAAAEVAEDFGAEAEAEPSLICQTEKTLSIHMKKKIRLKK